MTRDETGATDMPTEVAGEATREAIKTDLQVPDEADAAAPGATNATSSLIVDLPGQTYELRPDSDVSDLMLNANQSDEEPV